MQTTRLPEEWAIRIEKEMGLRSATAAAVQIVAYLLFRAFLARAGAVPLGADLAGAGVLTTMAARLVLSGLQRRSFPGRWPRARWKLLTRMLHCGGAASWGLLSAVLLQHSGITETFFLSMLINLGTASLTPQNVGLDRLLPRLFLPLIMGPPIVVAVLHSGMPGYLVLAVLLALYLVYQLVLARRAYALFVEALNNRAVVEAQNDHLAALLEAMPGYVMWTDSEARVLGMNPRSAAELGPEAFETLAADIRRFVTSGEEYWSEERQVPTLTGLRTHVLALRRWLAVEEQRVVLTGLDVEARKEAEREAELARMRALESARLGALGTMAAGIAHEINNPLQVFRFGTARLKRDLQRVRDMESRCAPVLQRMDRMVDRMASIVSGMRSLAGDGVATRSSQSTSPCSSRRSPSSHAAAEPAKTPSCSSGRCRPAS
jgi:PAS domain-containing protein